MFALLAHRTDGSKGRVVRRHHLFSYRINSKAKPAAARLLAESAVRDPRICDLAAEGRTGFELRTQSTAKDCCLTQAHP